MARSFDPARMRSVQSGFEKIDLLAAGFLAWIHRSNRSEFLMRYATNDALSPSIRDYLPDHAKTSSAPLLIERSKNIPKTRKSSSASLGPR